MPPMTPPTSEMIAIRVLRHCLHHAPSTPLAGVNCGLLAKLASSAMTQCPSCSGEPWVDPKCTVCKLCRALHDDRPVEAAAS